MRAAIRSLPRGALVCAIVALLNSVAWSLLTPPFHVPDENAHVGYVQYLAETGGLPKDVPGVIPYSPEERRLLHALDFGGVVGNDHDRPPWDAEEDRALRRVEDDASDRVGVGTVETASTNPPLYYALQAAPYLASPSSRLLDRLVLMRLLSALMAAGTVAAIYLFLRELFPRTSWAWPVGALAAAFQPTFGFIAGGVNSDNLLFLVSALLLLSLARAFSHGLNARTGAVIGAAVAAGVLTKFQFAGLLPAVALGAVILVLRASGRPRREAWRGLVVAGVTASIPVAVYVLLSVLVWDRGLVPSGPVLATGVESTRGAAGGVRDALSFMWQLFLPRLPWLGDHFPGVPLQTIWLNGLLGRFGWLDYGFPDWVYTLGLGICLAVVAAAAAALWRARDSLRPRVGELVTYATACAGLCALIALADYGAYRDGQPRIEQARYLLPLLALYAAVVAAAARLGGRRWGPVLGAALVGLAASHSLFSQILTLTRYYA